MGEGKDDSWVSDSWNDWLDFKKGEGNNSFGGGVALRDLFWPNSMLAVY